MQATDRHNIIKYYIGMKMELFVSLLCISTTSGNFVPINWTKVATLPLGRKTYMDYPPGIPPSCSCDMTANFCDISCCCDKDCTTFSIRNPGCPSPPTQSKTKASGFSQPCRYFGPLSPELHSIFCPIKENSPYMGLFYPPEQPIKDFQKYMSVVEQQNYNYHKETKNMLDEEFHPHYFLGSQVMVGENFGAPVRRGTLYMPQPAFDGFCVDSSVHFLEDLNHDCPIIMSTEKCESEASFRVASYLPPSDGSAAHDQPSALFQVIGNLSNLDLVNASVQYEWLENTSGYVKVQKAKVPAVLAPGSEADLGVNSFPYFDAATGQCHNVVLVVEYHLTWEGPTIVDIAATITLGSVPAFPEPKDPWATLRRKNLTYTKPLPSKLLPFSDMPQVFLSQHFMVQFHQSPSGSTSDNTTDFTQEEDNTEVSSITERSGNPGYLLDKPLLAGYVEYNTSKGEENITAFSDLPYYVHVNNSTGLYVWKADKSGKCQNSYIEKVKFGRDIISACYYTWSGMTHCSDLREILEEALYSLVQADVISIFGWPNVTKKEDFLPIILENYKENNKTSRGSRCVIPSSLEYKIMFQNVVDEPSPNFEVNQVIGAAVRLHYKKLPGEHKLSSGSLLLSSSVAFLQHQKPSGLSRFWEAMEDRWCERGTCWRELLWPWTHGWRGLGWAGQDHFSVTLASLLVQSILLLSLLIPPLTLTFYYQGSKLLW